MLIARGNGTKSLRIIYTRGYTQGASINQASAHSAAQGHNQTESIWKGGEATNLDAREEQTKLRAEKAKNLLLLLLGVAPSTREQRG